MQDRRFRGECPAIEGADLVAGRAAMKYPLLTIVISINRELKKIRAFMKAFVMALTRPCFEIGRVEEGHAILFKQNHYPALGRFIPEDLGIPGVVRAHLAIGVQNRISGSTVERSSIVYAVCDALHLFVRGAVESRIDQHERIFAPSSGILVVDETCARPRRAELVEHERGRQLLPVNQVLTDRVAPVHEAGVPLDSEGKGLPEEMILTVVKDGAVDVIAPATLDGKVKLRPIALLV